MYDVATFDQSEREDFFFCPECDLSNNEYSGQLNENSRDFLKFSWVSLSVPQSLKFWQPSRCHKTKNTINGGVSFVLINVPKVSQSLTISSLLRSKYFIDMGRGPFVYWLKGEVLEPALPLTSYVNKHIA